MGIDWIRNYVKTLTSTLHQDMDAAQRGVWNDFLLLAGDQDPKHGRFKIGKTADGEIDFEGLARLLNIHADLNTAIDILLKTFEKNKNAKRIKVVPTSDGFWVIIRNWHKYQDFTRKGVDIPKQEKGHMVDIHFQHKKRRDKKRLKEETRVSSQDLELASLLSEKIKENSPKATAKDLPIEAWADDIRLMREQDGRTPEDIRKVILWSQADSFWRGNILSGANLRKHFIQLWGKMNAGGGKEKTPAELEEEDERALKDPGR